MNNYRALLCSAAAVASIQCVHARTMNLQGSIYNVDTVAHYMAGPAMKYTRLAVSSAANTFGASVIEIDMKAPDRPYIKVEPGCDSVKTSERVTSVAQRKSNDLQRYVAAINGDFFITSSFAANHPLGTQILGYPNVTSATEGKIISPDAIDRESREKCFIITTDGKMYIDATDLSYTVSLCNSDISIKLDNANYPLSDNESVIYNSFYGNSTRTCDTGIEVTIELVEGDSWAFNRPIRFKVTDTDRDTGNSDIPANGAVIACGRNCSKAIAALEQCVPGDEISITIHLSLPSYGDISPDNISEIIGGDVRVLNQGKVTLSGDPDALRFINAPTTRYQRSLIGFSKDCDKLVLCCVDNGIGGGGVSYYDAGDLMLALGCYDALDLDGGGSTLMYLRTPGIVNHLRDGIERAVGNGIYTVVKAPSDSTVHTIRFADHAPRITKNTTYRPIFYGYNKNGELISMNVTGVRLNATHDLGYIQPDGSIFVTGEGCYPLEASFNGSTAKVAVTITSCDNGNKIKDNH